LARRIRNILLAACSLLAGCGWFEAGPVAADGGNEDIEVVDLGDTDILSDRIDGNDDTRDGLLEGDQIPEVGGEDVIQPDDLQDVPGEDAPDVPPSSCGNGTFEAGEACDDLNTVTELCGTGTECLGDCSMLEGRCGNAINDPGERCDDGNLDSMDRCTTSCTSNDRNIGAPCTCSGAGCSDLDFTAGVIQGCENVAVTPGSGGELACIRTPSWYPVSNLGYYAEGYCSLIAVICEGGGICSMVPSVGDLDTFSCPSGYAEHAGTLVTLGVTVTYKVCLLTCDSPSQCRWNAKEEASGQCGGMDCIPLPEDPSVRVCNDPRNFP
jgi:hypothetical protein